MWGSYDNIPKAIFYLLKGDYILELRLESLAFRVALLDVRPCRGGLKNKLGILMFILG